MTTEDNSRIPPLLPDLLGEYFVIDWLMLDNRTSNDERKAFIDGLWKFPSHAAEFMSRMWDDFDGLIVNGPDRWSKLLPTVSRVGSDSCAWLANWLTGCFANDSFQTSLLNDSIVYIKMLQERCRDEEDKKSLIRCLAFGLMRLTLTQEITESQATIEQLQSLSTEWVNLPEVSLFLKTAQMNVSVISYQKAVSQKMDFADKYMNEMLRSAGKAHMIAILFDEVSRVKKIFLAKGSKEEPFTLYCDLVVEQKEEEYQKAKNLLAQYANLYLHGENIDPTSFEYQLKNALYRKVDTLFAEDSETTTFKNDYRLMEEKRRSFSEIFLNEDQIVVSEFTSPHFRSRLKNAIERNIDFLLSFQKPNKSKLTEILKETGITYKGNPIVLSEEEREILLDYQRKEADGGVDDRSAVLLLSVIFPYLEEELESNYFAELLQDVLEACAEEWMRDQDIANKVLAARVYVMGTTVENNTLEQFSESMKHFYEMIEKYIEDEKGCYLAWGLVLIWISYYYREYSIFADFFQRGLEIYKNSLCKMDVSPFSQKLSQSVEQMVRTLFLGLDEDVSAIIDKSITLIDDEYQLSIKETMENSILFKD